MYLLSTLSPTRDDPSTTSITLFHPFHPITGDSLKDIWFPSHLISDLFSLLESLSVCSGLFSIVPTSYYLYLPSYSSGILVYQLIYCHLCLVVPRFLPNFASSQAFVSSRWTGLRIHEFHATVDLYEGRGFLIPHLECQYIRSGEQKAWPRFTSRCRGIIHSNGRG